MSLLPGLRIGPYEVVGALGAGGMGEVYRAHDTSLNRDVALKVLPAAVVGDHQRLARLQREAELLGALNHPNIAQVYAVVDHDGLPVIVMELVEGPTLEDLIAAAAGSDGTTHLRALAIDDVLATARQLATALEAAHERGIVHRDLKPANIKVRDDGTVKVLDFGLAKALESDGPGPPTGDAAESPTITTPAMTAQGIILGTAAYMSPEQARGRSVDRRADIWAFGVVAYEMLTGRRLFDGETVSDVLAAVLTKSPDLAALPTDLPRAIVALLGRCLERDPRQRLRDIGEARVVLERATAGESVSSIASATPVAVVPKRRRAAASLPWAVAAVAVIAAAWFGWRAADLPEVTPVRAELTPPHGTTYEFGSNRGGGVISPDGSMVAFRARSVEGPDLWVRTLATGETRALPDTGQAFYPFWAPDSRRLAFFARGQLMVVDVSGGLPERIADASQGRGGTWSDDDVILFTPTGGGTVHRVAAGGGIVTELTSLDASREENAHYWPVWLPGGRAFVFFIRSTRPENNGIYLGHVDGRPPVRLVTSLSSGQLSLGDDGTPWLLWVREGELLAQRLDAEAARLTGEAVVVARGVRVEESQRGLLVSASRDGTLVWASDENIDQSLTRYSRAGQTLGPLNVAPGWLYYPRLSPDDRRLAYTRATRGTADIWLHDLETGTNMPLTTDPGYDEQAIWSPDGRKVAHEAAGGVIAVQTLDGSAPVVPVSSDALADIDSWSGTTLLGSRERGQTGRDLAYLDLAKPGEMRSLTNEPGNEDGSALSPDGRWLAFSHEPAGRPEVVVAPLRRDGDGLSLGRPWVPVSSDGGESPRWRRDGRELMFISPDGLLQVVSVTPNADSVRIGPPTTLFKLTSSSAGADTGWTPSADFDWVIVVDDPGAARQTLQMLTHWFETVRR